MRRKIQEYRSVLENRAYEKDNIGLCEAFCYFGGIAFVAIGLSCRGEFLQCFYYYAMQFVQEWVDGGDFCQINEAAFAEYWIQIYWLL